MVRSWVIKERRKLDTVIIFKSNNNNNNEDNQQLNLLQGVEIRRE